MIRKTNPKYSICICNHNMADTLERALSSVLEQLNDDYEVLVIDDGSVDNSVKILRDLSLKYSLLRYIELKRDNKRKLGETRNISVREAYGEYVILHVDADDEWEPYIKDFVEVFRRIEACLERDVLLSGQQINIAKKSFLLKHGPYKNVHMFEDRDLWMRLAAIDVYIPLAHKVFRTRLKRTSQITTRKAIRDIWTRLIFDLRVVRNIRKYMLRKLFPLFVRPISEFSLKQRLVMMIMVIPAFFVSQFQEKLDSSAHEKFIGYRKRYESTYKEIMAKLGCDEDISFLSTDAQKIFTEKE